MSNNSINTALFLVVTTLSGSAIACGSEPYLGEVCTFANTYCPRGYAEADGRLLSIGQHQALFALMGTTFGGNGQTTFALPDLRGRTPVGNGEGPGLGAVELGEIGGEESAIINIANMPSHSHGADTTVTVRATLNAVASGGSTSNPNGKLLAISANRDNIYSSAAATVPMAPEAISTTTTNAATTIHSSGGGLGFSIRNPFVGLRYCVATSGVFPVRD